MFRTIGNVPKGAANRYWTYGTSVNRANLLAWLYWFVHTCLILLYSFILFVYLKLKYGKNVTNNQAQQAIDCIPLFIDIYPTSVYPLVVKSIELAYYKHYSLNEPTLELATGDGFFTNHLYAGRDNKVTIASDLIGSTLLQAKKYKFWRKLAIIDSTQVPLPGNSLSTIIMNNLIHHLPDRLEVLKEMHRILRTNGLFIFTDELTGWATSQWRDKVNRSNINNFLNESIQCLLRDSQFWIEQGQTHKWEICDIKEFFSNRSMFLSSYLETLNRKIGAPTPKPIRDILDKLPLLKIIQIYLTTQIAESLITRDAELCKRYGATSVFVALRKKGRHSQVNDTILVCPICKNNLTIIAKGNYCWNCDKTYPFFGDIPFLISYCDDLPVQVFDDIENKLLLDVSC